MKIVLSILAWHRVLQDKIKNLKVLHKIFWVTLWKAKFGFWLILTNFDGNWNTGLKISKNKKHSNFRYFQFSMGKSIFVFFVLFHSFSNLFFIIWHYLINLSQNQSKNTSKFTKIKFLLPTKT